jgi:hypothetical protein
MNGDLIDSRGRVRLGVQTFRFGSGVQTFRFGSGVQTFRFGSGVQTFRFGSIRGLSFFEKKTQFEVQVFLQKKLEPRIELILNDIIQI